MQKEISSKDGTRLSYHISNPGKKKAIVFLHGAGSNHTVWKNIADMMIEDFNDTSFIIPEFRGHGRSGHKGPKKYSIDQLKSDIREIIDHEAADVDIALIGNSLGAAVAYEYHLSYPRHIKCIVLISLFGKKMTSYGAFLRTINNIAYTIIRLFPMRKELKSEDYAKMRAKKPWYFPIADMKSTHLRIYSAAVRAVLNHDMEIAGIIRNTLIIQGKNDFITKKKFISNAAKKNPLVMIAMLDADHLAINKEPKKCAELISKYLKEQMDKKSHIKKQLHQKNNPINKKQSH